MAISWVIKRQSEEGELVLSNYPKLFEKEVLVVVGENASQIELEGSEVIVASLEELTGNKPVVKDDVKVSKSEKESYNLILVGTSESNGMLEETWSAAEEIKMRKGNYRVEELEVIRVTETYPGRNRGILEILRNPWNKEKAVLLVEGSDEIGVKAGVEKLKHTEELEGLNYNNILVKYPPGRHPLP